MLFVCVKAGLTALLVAALSAFNLWLRHLLQEAWPSVVPVQVGILYIVVIVATALAMTSVITKMWWGFWWP